MEKTIRIFRSHAEAEQADIERDRALTPNERIEVLLELQKWMYKDGDQQGFERICRVTQFERS